MEVKDPEPSEDVTRVGASSQTEDRGWFSFVDLYAGIGGFRKAFESIGGRCIFASEWDSHAQKTYIANFGDPANSSYQLAGDINPFADNPEQVPEHDVLVAGFPCQPFSLAGISKRKSLGCPHGLLCETEGTAFYNLAKILERRRPAAFLLENVKNLINHDNGKTIKMILGVLQLDLGYKVQYKVIDSQYWVPQKRQRIYIAGFLSHDGFTMPNPSEQILSGGLPPPTKILLGHILEPNPPTRYTLSEHLWQYLQDYKQKHRSAGNGFGYSVFGPNDVSRTLSARYHKDGSEILIEQEAKRPRRLTPRECSRLMGFDSPAGTDFKIPVSDTQAYKQFGNAVVVPVVTAIAQEMKRHIFYSMKHKCPGNRGETSSAETST